MPWSIWVFPDSAYRALEVDCLALRAAVIMIANVDFLPRGGPAGPVEHYVRKQPRVCRSTFSAELAGYDDGSSMGIVIQGLLSEILYGPLHASNLNAAMENGDLPVKLQITADNKGLYSALAAEEMKRPAEPHLMYLLRAQRDRLLHGTVFRVWWVDTRDMISDALTKGGISKDVILKLWKEAEMYMIGDAPVGHSKVCRTQL
jgi:hypothetical protein